METAMSPNTAVSACPTSLGDIAGCEPQDARTGNGSCFALPLPIADEFVCAILKPYRAHAIYLKSAAITHVHDGTAAQDASGTPPLITGTGRFSIAESCYIDDTGHFNAVEFNI